MHLVQNAAMPCGNALHHADAGVHIVERQICEFLGSVEADEKDTGGAEIGAPADTHFDG